MKNLLKPQWLILINTLPIVLLFVLGWGAFNTIKSMLNDQQMSYWMIYSTILAGLGIVHFVYAIYQMGRGSVLPTGYAMITLVVYISFLYVYVGDVDSLVPWSIPRWIFSGNLLLYVGTFLMPTLAHALLVLVVQFTPNEAEQKSGYNFLFAVAVPIVFYLFMQLVLPLWRPTKIHFSRHVWVVFLVTGVISFLFFLVRGLYILASKKQEILRSEQLLWKIPISFIFPILGLLLNNGLLIDFIGLGRADGGIFGDFSDGWFYGLAMVNGVFICLPNGNDTSYRLWLFIARSISFVYTFYFFLVFLPYLPFSVLAIILLGLGFLMLTPLALFVIHLAELTNDYQFLRRRFSNNTLIVILFFSLAVIPTFLVVDYLEDKRTLIKTLDFLYHPDYSDAVHINKSSLAKSLSVFRQHKARGGFLSYSNQVPYLSSLYNWLVLDNMTLSNQKIARIEKTFWGIETPVHKVPTRFNSRVNLSKISSHSYFDDNQKAWISWVDMELTNENESNRLGEYTTTIDLPTGCWISDYYLNIGDRKEYGILTEKKAAMWVYSQIRNQRRDPGLLHYLTGNKVAFRVFPFSHGEVRKTGIQLIHKEPVSMVIDGHNVQLGVGEITKPSGNTEKQAGKVIYISAKEKQNLPLVYRKPYYHFIIDVSKKEHPPYFDYIQNIKSCLANQAMNNDLAKISFVNAYVHTQKMDIDWEQDLQQKTLEGGFNLDRAIKEILFQQYQQPNDTYPIMVVVSDEMDKAILPNDFADFRVAFPEGDSFYHLGANGTLIAHSLLLDPLSASTDVIPFKTDKSVFVWTNANHPIAYLANDQNPEIVVKSPIFNVDLAFDKDENWQAGLLMQGLWQSQVFYPKQSKNAWLNLVQNSFLTQIMTPLTSYIVVENEAQKAMLKKKQKQVLAGNKSLDLSGDVQRMSEPGLWWILGLLLIWIIRRSSYFSSSIRRMRGDNN